jgi:tyrosyl-DNA phosphodiesterase 2
MAFSLFGCRNVRYNFLYLSCFLIKRRRSLGCVESHPASSELPQGSGIIQQLQSFTNAAAVKEVRYQLATGARKIGSAKMADQKNSQGEEQSLQAKLAEAMSKPLTQHEEVFYRPRPQSYFSHDGSEWQECKSPSRRWWNASGATSSSPYVSASSAISKATKIRLISWNIDILVPFGHERMSAALAYLETLISSSPPEVPIVIFLQEMSPSDMQLIRDAGWVKQAFMLADLDQKNWLGGMYGTQVLVDRRLTVERVFRVPWVSRFDRDGLFVDLCLRSDGREEKDTHDARRENAVILRLCNTHLESLVANPPIRPLQLSAAAKYLHEENVAAALLAGDLNAIEPFDRSLHSDNGLEDAYLTLGSKEDNEEGYTWGIQVPQWLKDKFGPSRMDKILYRGELKPQCFERIGIDVKVDDSVKEEVWKKGAEEWVTDHYGVMGDFELTGNMSLAFGGGGPQERVSL